MVTRSAISTISYNSDYFLYRELSALVVERVIEFFAFVNHLPEEDEKKEHKHLFIIPSSNLDTFTLQKRLQEIDLQNPTMPPLGCILFKHSKFADWYLYCIHDIDYLASKNEMRKYHYTIDDIVSNSADYLNELVHSSDFSKYKTFAKLRDAVSSGVSFRELVYNGFIPVQQIIQYKKAYLLLKYGDTEYSEHTCRAGRNGHETDENSLI